MLTGLQLPKIFGAIDLFGTLDGDPKNKTESLLNTALRINRGLRAELQDARSNQNLTIDEELKNRISDYLSRPISQTHPIDEIRTNNKEAQDLLNQLK